MELKPYQQRVINDLEEFLVKMETAQRIDYAFRAFWAERGVTGMESYKNNVKAAIIDAMQKAGTNAVLQLFQAICLLGQKGLACPKLSAIRLASTRAKPRKQSVSFPIFFMAQL